MCFERNSCDNVQRLLIAFKKISLNFYLRTNYGLDPLRILIYYDECVYASNKRFLPLGPFFYH